MSRLDIALTDVKEPEVAEEGTYDMIVDKAELVEKDNGKVNIVCQILFDGMPEYSAIWHYISIPTSDDAEKTAVFKKLMLKRFLSAFNVPMDEDGFDVESIVGATGSVPVVQEEYEGRISNKLRLPAIS